MVYEINEDNVVLLRKGSFKSIDNDIVYAVIIDEDEDYDDDDADEENLCN